MKDILFIALLFVLTACHGQNQSINNDSKNDSMQVLDLTKYTSWEIDNYYSPSTGDQFLKKGLERVKILDFKDKIKIERSNINSPITHNYMYDKNTKRLQLEGQVFYTANYGVWNYYQGGKLVKEEDMDKPFKFSIPDVVNKFKKEYHVDIENPKNVFRFNKLEEKDKLHIPIYEIGLNTSSPSVWTFYLIDGNTGKTLYTTKVEEGETKNVLQEYLKSL